MDVLTAAPGPALPLGIAIALGVLTLVLAAGLALSARRPERGAPAAPDTQPAGVFVHDDLPAFREHPPGFPGARPVPAGAQPPVADDAPDRDPLRAIAVMGLAALVLLTAAAAVAAAAVAAEPDPPDQPSSGRPTASRTPDAPVAPPAPVTTVPASPTAGQPGAGELADASVPVGEDGVAARLTFGGVVLEQHAVGITVTYPRVSVTAADDGTALAHVVLPTWNCMTEEPPADPAAAGCRKSVTEYADLPAPALEVGRGDDGLRLHGRFPTYTRPNGTGPLYTGRVYELDVTAERGRALADGWAAAEGRLSLGTGHTESVDDGVSVLRAGG